MSLYKDSNRQAPSAERYAKYAESIHDSADSNGFGLTVATNPKEALRNLKLQQMMLQKEPQLPMYPWQQQMLPQPPMMQGPVVPQHMGTPKGFIGNNPYNPYTYM